MSKSAENNNINSSFLKKKMGAMILLALTVHQGKIEG